VSHAQLPQPGRGSRQRKPVDQVVQYLRGMTRREQPVREHRYGEGLHVIGDHVIAPVERSVRTTRADQVQRGPGRRAELQVRMGASRGDQADGPGWS